MPISKTDILSRLDGAIQSWTPPALPPDLPHGDMPGDKVVIGPDHIRKANTLFPALLPLLRETLAASPRGKAVISVAGGSGVGKSETASLLTWYLRALGVGSYTLSGDNYPRRIPLYNDAERMRIFRVSGLRGMLEEGTYTPENGRLLRGLWETEEDPDPALRARWPWLESYQRRGRAGLAGYLGTEKEQDFDELSAILARFKAGEETVWLKRMGREHGALWYDPVDMSGTPVLILEWTHGLSANFTGVDLPLLLASTPEETREHRRSRGRDGKTDSPFTTMVLEIEQGQLEARAPAAKLILSKGGELINLDAYRRAMAEHR